MKLKDLAEVVRSKNSGPFEVTLDILFVRVEDYQLFKRSNILSPERLVELYHLQIKDIVQFSYFDAALGLKMTYLRSVSSGTSADRDVYGAQQYAPLLELDIPT